MTNSNSTFWGGNQIGSILLYSKPPSSSLDWILSEWSVQKMPKYIQVTMEYKLRVRRPGLSQTRLGCETTDELNPLKGLTRLLTLVRIMRKGGERISRTQESYLEELLGELQENLTEVLWWRLWPLYTTHNVCTWLYGIYQYCMHKANPRPWAVGAEIK